jgi:Tfp pilus assembly protein PilO
MTHTASIHYAKSVFSLQEQDLKLSVLESESRKMKVELEEFRTEAAHLKNQQATIRRLEERNRQLEQQVCVCFSMHYLPVGNEF